MTLPCGATENGVDPRQVGPEFEVFRPRRRTAERHRAAKGGRRDVQDAERFRTARTVDGHPVQLDRDVLVGVIDHEGFDAQRGLREELLRVGHPRAEPLRAADHLAERRSARRDAAGLTHPVGGGAGDLARDRDVSLETADVAATELDHAGLLAEELHELARKQLGRDGEAAIRRDGDGLRPLFRVGAGNDFVGEEEAAGLTAELLREFVGAFTLKAGKRLVVRQRVDRPENRIPLHLLV